MKEIVCISLYWGCWETEQERGGAMNASRRVKPGLPLRDGVFGAPGEEGRVNRVDGLEANGEHDEESRV